MHYDAAGAHLTLEMSRPLLKETLDATATIEAPNAVPPGMRTAPVPQFDRDPIGGTGYYRVGWGIVIFFPSSLLT